MIQSLDVHALTSIRGLEAHDTSDGSPSYTVPAIHHVPTDKYIMDSPTIAEFLESTYPDPELLLASDLDREIEKKKTWEERVDKIGKLSDLALKNKDKGPFLFGEKPSSIDFFIAAKLQSARTIHEGIFERCAEDPGFKAIYEACVPYMGKKD
ncbi:glutathione S-transferase [Fusarium mundagurra]|uniref:Glutathione S-transferase n=1 Tax=Fusarium mundagurra TaxID=1567541 RepID=A0A8H5XT18_9HYPO|nr:glutathione S-transferase [Fusarium mundagurra]